MYPERDCLHFLTVDTDGFNAPTPTAGTTAPAARSRPDTLNVGCGKARLEGALNVDLSPRSYADLLYDLRRFPWPFAGDLFTHVQCHDVLEHLPDTIRTMEEIHRLCKPGATVAITTPHFSCANAFTDPTHCHQFGYFSFDFLTGDATHNHYTDVRFSYLTRQLVFHPSRKNILLRRLANRFPSFYERHLCWILPAWFVSVELLVIK